MLLVWWPFYSSESAMYLNALNAICVTVTRLARWVCISDCFNSTYNLESQCVSKISEAQSFLYYRGSIVFHKHMHNYTIQAVHWDSRMFCSKTFYNIVVLTFLNYIKRKWMNQLAIQVTRCMSLQTIREH